jgi:hypothetical protein
MSRNVDPQVSFVAQGDFGPVLGHGNPARGGFAPDDIWAAKPTTPEHHQFVLDRFPRLAVLQGATRENAAKILGLAANRRLGLRTAWNRANQAEPEDPPASQEQA